MFTRLHLAARLLPWFTGILALVTVATAAPQAGLPTDKRLNILFIMSDQHNARLLGYADNGYGGVTNSLTPVLDQLAQEGIRFDTALCPTAQCSPTRYSYINGRWPHNHGLRWNGIWEPRGGITLPEMARKAGYETATIGKHHLLWLRQTPGTEDFGFNQVTDLRTYVQFINDGGFFHFLRPGNFFGMPGLPQALATFTGFTLNANELHPAGYWADQVIDFLEARATDEKPFLCYYSMYGPHTPITPTGPASPQDWAHLYHPFQGLGLPPNLNKVSTTSRLSTAQNVFAAVTDDEWREIISYYYGFITQIDFNIGRVLDRLDQLGLADNTLVIYTADHGEMSAEMGIWEKGAGSYDAITRVPLILRLPGVIPPSQVSADLVNTLDLVPTIYELAGIPIQDSDQALLDGRSMVDVLLGKTPVDWPLEVFNEFGTKLIPHLGRHRMVRTANYKYSFDELGGGQEEFYDMVADEFEMTNLINDPDPTIQAGIADLKARLDLWWNEETDHVVQYEVSGDFAAPPAVATKPVPASGTHRVPRDLNPSWLPSSASETQRFYLGQNPSNMALVHELIGIEDSINLGTLRAKTTYYWRVDATNLNGTTVGPVWSFRTTPGGGLAPTLASIVSPVHRKPSTSLTPTLRWKPGQRAEWQELFFGPTGELEPLTRMDRLTKHQTLDQLQADITYQWRVDSVRKGSRTEGDLWEFTTTSLGLPRITIPLQPAHMDEATVVQPGGLSWFPIPGQTSYDVYFGQSLPLQFMGRQSGTTFDHGLLAPNETYYWRIDSVNNRGVARGFNWRFTTAP